MLVKVTDGVVETRPIAGTRQRGADRAEDLALAEGLLADPKPGAKFNYDDAPPALIERAQMLAQVCHAHGVPLKAAAIQFPAFHPAVRSILTGARTVHELDENVAMSRVRIPPGLWDELRVRGLIAQAAPTNARIVA